MAQFETFLSGEAGAITVDWTVLTAGLAGLAMAVSWLFADQIGQLNYNVGAKVQNRDTRPSYAYVPHDIVTHEHFKTALGTLNADDLGEVSGWANATRSAWGALPEAEGGLLKDFDNAITVSYGERNGSRESTTDYDERAVERIMGDLGFGTAPVETY